MFCFTSLFLEDTVSLKMPQGAKKNSLFGRKQKVHMKREGKVTLTTHSNQSKNKKSCRQERFWTQATQAHEVRASKMENGRIISKYCISK